MLPTQAFGEFLIERRGLLRGAMTGLLTVFSHRV